MDHFCFKLASQSQEHVGICLFHGNECSHTAADELNTDEDVFLLAVQYGMMQGNISGEGEEPHLLP